MNSFGYYMVLGIIWGAAAGFQLNTLRLLPPSMRGLKFWGMFSSILNLGLASVNFVRAFQVGI